MLSRGRAAACVSDAGWLRAMLDFEAGLARAQARAGVIDDRAAEGIEAACGSIEPDADSIGQLAADTGNPVPALLAEVVAGAGEGAPFVHLGATSQDAMDTASMLVAKRSLAYLSSELEDAAEAAARLARIHRDTPMTGRTLMQQALPATFGCVAANWLGGLDRSALSLERVAGQLPVQLGGAAGTLASLGDRGVLVLGYLAEELGLAEPAAPWHTDRTRIAELAGALGETAGAVAKVALDVALLASSDIGEVHEGVAGRGGSSTLPQKRNPIAAVTARACATRAPGLVATLLALMPQELQRSAGGWQAEWPALSDLLATTGSAVAWLKDCLENLEVDEARMRANLEAAGTTILSERVSLALAPSLGRARAHGLVAEAVAEVARSTGGASFADVLMSRPEIASSLDEEAIVKLLDPTTYLGSAGAFVDRALRAHETRLAGTARP